MVGPLAAAAADSGGFWLLRARILLCLYGDLSHTRRAPLGKSQPAIGSGWVSMRSSGLGPGRLKVKASCAGGRGSSELSTAIVNHDILTSGSEGCPQLEAGEFVTRQSSHVTKIIIYPLYHLALDTKNFFPVSYF